LAMRVAVNVDAQGCTQLPAKSSIDP